MKSKHILYLITIVASIAFLSGCEDAININEDRNIIPQPATIKPLEIGNEWIYQISNYDDSGNITSTFTEKHIIVRKYNDASNAWWVEEIGDNVPKVNVSYSNYNKGLWTDHGTDLFSPDEPYLLVPYPITPGNELIIGRGSDINNNIIETFRRADQALIKIVTNAGTFYTIKYTDRLKDKDGNILNEKRNITYYAPNVGMIKAEIYDKDKEGKIILSQTQELISYKLK